MLKEKSTFIRKTELRVVKGVTLTNIHFKTAYGTTLMIPYGTRLLIDIQSEIAHYRDHHFDIGKDEYKELPSNFKADSKIVYALLKEAIILDEENTISLAKGSLIEVDTDEGIGSYNSCHFDVAENEYSVIY